jgi:hypothetical protein
MALTLDRIVTFNLSQVIAGQVQAVVAERTLVRSKKESDFQIAIAEGTMSFESQQAFRQKQLDDELRSGNPDKDYIAELRISIGDIKKQARFQQIRDKYKASLSAYADGKGNLSTTISLLKEALGNETEPGIRSELQSQLQSALSARTTLEREAIQNRIIMAEKDRSIPLLEKSIKEIKGKKAEALLAGDKDTATMWDATLTSLESQKSVIQIETTVADMNYAIAKGGLTSGQKMGLINDAISGATGSGAVVYDGVRYDSMKDFWSRQQADYISRGYFTELNNELEAETNRIAQQSPYGQVPVERIVAVSDFYKTLSARPEFAPYAQQIEQQRVATVSTLAGELQGALNDEAMAAMNMGQDPSTVERKTYGIFSAIENRLGIKLGAGAQTSELGRGGGLAPTITAGTAAPAVDPMKTGALPAIGAAPAAQTAPVFPSFANDPDVITDNVTGQSFKKGASGTYERYFGEAPTPVAAPAPKPQTVTPTPIPTPTSAGGGYTVAKGDTLSAIAAKSGMNLADLLAKNPGIKDPNKIQIGQKLTF